MDFNSGPSNLILKVVNHLMFTRNIGCPKLGRRCVQKICIYFAYLKLKVYFSIKKKKKKQLVIIGISIPRPNYKYTQLY